jgi:WD40 repeat protein
MRAWQASDQRRRVVVKTSHIAAFMAITLLGFVFSVRAQPAPSASGIAWSPTGEELAVLYGGSLLVLDSQYTVVREHPSDAVVSVYWSPRGDQITAGYQIFDAQTLEPRLNIESDTYLGGWNNDGSRVFALVDGVMNIGIFDPMNGLLVEKIEGDGEIIDGAAWSPDGTHFAVQFGNQSRMIVDMQDKREVYVETMYAVSSLHWSPDSKQLAGVSIREVEEGTPGSIPTAGSTVLISAHIWDAETLEERITISGLPNYPLLRWSPDGQQLLGASPIGTIYIWDAATGAQVDQIEAGGIIISVEYHPSGDRIAVGRTLRDDSVPSTVRADRLIAERFDGALQIIALGA